MFIFIFLILEVHSKMYNGSIRKIGFRHCLIKTHSIKCVLFQRGFQKRLKGPSNSKTSKLHHVCCALGPLKQIRLDLKNPLIFFGSQLIFNGMYLGHPMSKSRFFGSFIFWIYQDEHTLIKALNSANIHLGGSLFINASKAFFPLSPISNSK